MFEVNLEEYRSNSDSLSNHSGQEYSLLEDDVNSYDEKGDDCNMPREMCFRESKLCYSTPMVKNEDDLNSVDSFNTFCSTSDLFKTAISGNESEVVDMDISSCCNDSNNIDDCKVYEDFVMGRNNSMNEEDINGIEKTVCVVDICEFSDDRSQMNNNVINDNTIVQNDLNLTSNCSVDNGHKFKNEAVHESSEVTDQECSNRTLLDESGYTENLLCTPEKGF